MRPIRVLLSAAAVLLCSGCAVPIGSDGRYLGYVEVHDSAPSTAVDVAHGGPAVRYRRVFAIGGWLETAPATGALESIGLGVRKARRLEVPMDCRVVIIVGADGKVGDLTQFRSMNRGKDPCVVTEGAL